VLRLRSSGAPVKQVASELGITTHAVNKHSSAAFRKLGASNIGSAVVAARRLNLIPRVRQDFYAGKGPKPAMPLAPGTNSPDPDQSISVVVNPPQVAVTVPPATPGAAPQIIQVPVPVPSATAVPAAAVTQVAKHATAKQRKAYRKCVKAASKKHGNAHRKARARCARMPH
jgi:hypothetical protein